jgi:hypothetical protein
MAVKGQLPAPAALLLGKQNTLPMWRRLYGPESRFGSADEQKYPCSCRESNRRLPAHNWKWPAGTKVAAAQRQRNKKYDVALANNSFHISSVYTAHFSCYVLVFSQHSGLACRNMPHANQPRRVTKGGVRRRRETSSLARSNHSCVRNALLEMVNGALN